MGLFEPVKTETNLYAESVFPSARGKCYKSPRVGDAKVHDANFAFLSTTLAKLNPNIAEPKFFVTYMKDVPVEHSNSGFVDFIVRYEVNYAGIINEFRNIMGNDANFIPRVNAGLSQKKVNVYTFEVAYDLRFIELEKMKQVDITKSIKEIYQNAITTGWDLFCQKIAYVGSANGTGLFNSPKVQATLIANAPGHNGFDTMTDADIIGFFNGVFEASLTNGNMNPALQPDTFLVPIYVGKQLSSRFSSLYTSTLRSFLLEHNLGTDETGVKITIESRSDLNTLGTNGKGRIVAYKKDKSFVNMEIPYDMQHFITQPNVERMAYTSAFVGQVSEVVLPYNSSATEPGVVSYWDFTYGA